MACFWTNLQGVSQVCPDDGPPPAAASYRLIADGIALYFQSVQKVEGGAGGLLPVVKGVQPGGVVGTTLYLPIQPSQFYNNHDNNHPGVYAGATATISNARYIAYDQDNSQLGTPSPISGSTFTVPVSGGGWVATVAAAPALPEGAAYQLLHYDLALPATGGAPATTHTGCVALFAPEAALDVLSLNGSPVSVGYMEYAVASLSWDTTSVYELAVNLRVLQTNGDPLYLEEGENTVVYTVDGVEFTDTLHYNPA